MAKITKRTWTSQGPLGRKVRHVAYGYTLMLPDGTRERKASSDWLTEEDALRALLARQGEIGAGRVEARAERTFTALASEYLAYKRDRGKRSIAEDERIFATRLLPAFGPDTPLQQITTAAIAQYERRRLADVSAYTIGLELATLRHALRLAKRWGYLDAVPEFDMPTRPEGRTRYLDEAEIERLLAACRRSQNPHLATIVTLAINTGMRRGEVLGLTWERVDLASARITLYETKNGRPRGVPINRAVYEALIALEPDAAPRAGLLFRRSGGRAWGKIRTAFEKAVERADLKDVRFHDLRHTAASHMVMRGAQLREVQEILGHRTFAMTLRYSHLSTAHVRTAVDRLDGLTTPAAQGPTASFEVENITT